MTARTSTLTRYTLAALDIRKSVVRTLQKLHCRVYGALELNRQRRQLLTLDDRLLKDMGISRADAEREAQRSVWDDPFKQIRF